jgi:hypothetical protein
MVGGSSICICVVGPLVVEAASVGFGVVGSAAAVGLKLSSTGLCMLETGEAAGSLSLLGLHKPLLQRIPTVTSAPRMSRATMPKHSRLPPGVLVSGKHCCSAFGGTIAALATWSSSTS